MNFNNQSHYWPLLKKITGGRVTPDAAISLLLTLMALLLAARAVASLTWPLRLDNAMMHYMGFLVVEHNFTPYRQIFEPNMPFGILLHGVLGYITRYSAIALQGVNLLVLLTMLYFIRCLLAPFGKRAGYFAALLFGNLLLAVGPMYSFERDYLAVLPVLAALHITLGQKRPVQVTALTAGVLFAMAASLKPHMVIGIPLLLVYLQFAWELSPRRAALQVYAPAAAGFIAVFALPFLWLWAKGGVGDYITILRSYLPLYSGGGNLAAIAAGIKKLGGQPLLLVPAAVGAYYVFTELPKPVTRKAALLLLFAAAYAVYPGIAGRFFPYHWFPWFCFGSVAAGLLLADYPAEALPARKTFPAAAAALFLLLVVSPKLWLGSSAAEQRGTEMTDVLAKHCKPGDTLQVLDDVTAEPFAALLAARVVPATRFLEDSQFYHDAATPYIRGLRAEFLAALTAAPPRFMLVPNVGAMSLQEQKPLVFPELYLFLHNRYSPAGRGSGFILYRRNDAL